MLDRSLRLRSSFIVRDCSRPRLETGLTLVPNLGGLPVVISKTSLPLCLGVLLVSANAFAQNPVTPPEQGAQTKEESYCASLPEKQRRATEKCKTEEERREDDYQRRVAERLEREKPRRTSFLKWLHVDGL